MLNGDGSINELDQSEGNNQVFRENIGNNNEENY